MTESGKTTLAKREAKAIREAGFEVIILDPMQDPSWSGDYKVRPELVFADKDAFIDRVFTAKSCYIYVDEAGSAIGKYDKIMDKLATQGRHFGHSCTFITQYYKDLSKTIRSQCSVLTCFTLPLDDGKELAKDFNQPGLKEVNNLKQFEYLRCGRYTELKRCCLFSNNNIK